MKNIRITAKDMVEFIHTGGDLTSEFKSNKRAMQGTEAHAFLQSKYGENDRKEVTVETLYDVDNYSFHVTGRMDGLLTESGKLVIEEIKSTLTDLHLMKIDTRPEHLSQAKMYAYMYCIQESLRSISVRLTYISVHDNQTKSFTKRYNITQLTRFFEDTVFSYVSWLKILDEHQLQKQKSIE